MMRTPYRSAMDYSWHGSISAEMEKVGSRREYIDEYILT